MIVSIHHVQRHHKEVWKLVEKLECYWGCLVDVQGVLTPNKSQCSPHQCNQDEEVNIYTLTLHNMLLVAYTVNSGQSGLRLIRTFAASEQIFLSLQQQCLTIQVFTSANSDSTPRYPDGFKRPLQCPDWPELTVYSHSITARRDM